MNKKHIFVGRLFKNIKEAPLNIKHSDPYVVQALRVFDLDPKSYWNHGDFEKDLKKYQEEDVIPVPEDYLITVSLSNNKYLPVVNRRTLGTMILSKKGFNAFKSKYVSAYNSKNINVVEVMEDFYKRLNENAQKKIESFEKTVRLLKEEQNKLR